MPISPLPNDLGGGQRQRELRERNKIQINFYLQIKVSRGSCVNKMGVENKSRAFIQLQVIFSFQILNKKLFRKEID